MAGDHPRARRAGRARTCSVQQLLRELRNDERVGDGRFNRPCAVVGVKRSGCNGASRHPDRQALDLAHALVAGGGEANNSNLEHVTHPNVDVIAERVNSFEECGAFDDPFMPRFRVAHGKTELRHGNLRRSFLKNYYTRKDGFVRLTRSIGRRWRSPVLSRPVQSRRTSQALSETGTNRIDDRFFRGVSLRSLPFEKQPRRTLRSAKARIPLSCRRGGNCATLLSCMALVPSALQLDHPPESN